MIKQVKLQEKKIQVVYNKLNNKVNSNNKYKPINLHFNVVYAVNNKL